MTWNLKGSASVQCLSTLGMQIHVTVSRLIGTIPQLRDQALQSSGGETVPVDVLVEANLAVEGHVFDGPVRTVLVPLGPKGCEWSTSDQQNLIPFVFKARHPALLAAACMSAGQCQRCSGSSGVNAEGVVQVCDLLAASVLAVSVLVFSESGAPAAVVGSAVMPLFNKKGRLKTGFQKVKLCLKEPPDLHWPSKTPGKVPSSQRGQSEALDQKLKQLERRELPHCAWLDRKTLKAIQEKQAAAELVRTSSRPYKGCKVPLHLHRPPT